MRLQSDVHLTRSQSTLTFTQSACRCRSVIRYCEIGVTADWSDRQAASQSEIKNLGNNFHMRRIALRILRLLGGQ